MSMLFHDHETFSLPPVSALAKSKFGFSTRFGFIMADPPWHFAAGGDRGAREHYDTMSLDSIKALPVAGLALENSLLWLWGTAPMLDQQLDVLRAWGFEFKTQGAWFKTTKTGKIAFGTGYILRNAHEPFLIGTRGNPETSRSVRSAFTGRLREHSRKPDEAYQAAEKLMPSAPKIELFSRANRPGWACWGNETGKFDDVE